ncbi:MAG: ABC transporter substrate-binding protein [Oleiphilus sp.]|nr:MAG: ABC transporter substrate-binding protein [Oleiphilus sp.]
MNQTHRSGSVAALAHLFPARQIVALVLFCLLGAIASTASARDCSRLVATGNPEYPPYLFRQSIENNNLVGANTEIFQKIAKQLDIDIEVIYTGPWSRAQKEVREGRIDLIAGAFFTVPRAQYMDYIYPAFLTTQSVVWNSIKKPIQFERREDLIGKKGVTVIHNSFGQEFDSFAKEKLDIDTVPSLEQAFTRLDRGRADYLLYERSPALAYTSIWGIDDQHQVAGPAISAEGLYLTISHKSECNTGELRGRLTQAVREIVESGQAEKALKDGLETWRSMH